MVLKYKNPTRIKNEKCAFCIFFISQEFGILAADFWQQALIDMKVKGGGFRFGVLLGIFSPWESLPDRGLWSGLQKVKASKPSAHPRLLLSSRHACRCTLGGDLLSCRVCLL